MDTLMDNLQAVLESVVNDLEKTTGHLHILEIGVQAMAPKSLGNLKDAMQNALKENEDFYDKLREQIKALSTKGSL